MTTDTPCICRCGCGRRAQSGDVVCTECASIIDSGVDGLSGKHGYDDDDLDAAALNDERT